jgi:hypothetical protein
VDIYFGYPGAWYKAKSESPAVTQILPYRPRLEKSVADTKKFLGEKGYVICDVALEYRRSKQDFIAYHKDDVELFIVVRATARGWISMTPFLRRHRYNKLLEDFNQHKETLKPIRLSWSQKSLYLPSRYGWVGYFPPEVRARIKILRDVA